MRALTGADQAFFASEERLALLPVHWTNQLLSRCVPGLSSPEDLTIGKRESLLLELRQISFGDRLDCVLECPATGCGQKLDLELKVSALLTAGLGNAEEEYQAGHVRFRLLTGADQEKAAMLALSDPGAAAELLLERCVLSSGERLQEATRDALSARILELDPMAELRIDVRCAACGGTFSTLFDAASYLRQELRTGLKNLYREVHTIAWHYHWSSAEILGLPVAERKRYLELIDEQLSEGGLA